jgi:hypothetical protein
LRTPSASGLAAAHVLFGLPVRGFLFVSLSWNARSFVLPQFSCTLFALQVRSPSFTCVSSPPDVSLALDISLSCICAPYVFGCYGSSTHVMVGWISSVVFSHSDQEKCVRGAKASGKLRLHLCGISWCLNFLFQADCASHYHCVAIRCPSHTLFCQSSHNIHRFETHSPGMSPLSAKSHSRPCCFSTDEALPSRDREICGIQRSKR